VRAVGGRDAGGRIHQTPERAHVAQRGKGERAFAMEAFVEDLARVARWLSDTWAPRPADYPPKMGRIVYQSRGTDTLARPSSHKAERPLMLEETDPQIDGGGSESTISRPLEISNSISRLHKEFVGRGPTNSRTTIDGNLVVCLLEGGYTRAEQTLTANDKGDLVAAGRLGLQDAMRKAMIAAVEQTTGRRVHSFMSANDLEQNLQVEVFVLAPEQDQGISGLGG
jgi:uncharacterized protein YbcI